MPSTPPGSRSSRGRVREPEQQVRRRFIGEANFFDGTVVACDGSEVGIALGALTVYAPFTGDVGGLGRSASLSVRPERLRIKPRTVVRERKRNVYDATVEEHDYLGAVVRYYLRLGEGLIVKVDEHNVAGLRYRPGEAVTVEIPPDDCFVLPAAD